MNTKSIHNKVNSILKKFGKGEKEKEKYYKDYDKADRVQEVTLKELPKLSECLKKGIN